MSKIVRDSKLKCALKKASSGRRKNPRQYGPNNKGPASGGVNCVLVIGDKSNYWITAKQARYKLRERLAVILSSKPFVLKEARARASLKDDLIIEKVFSCLVSRKMREHREELIHQVSMARNGKPRKAYIESAREPSPYVPVPFGFGIN
jgi:hypothetical protein